MTQRQLPDQVHPALGVRPPDGLRAQFGTPFALRVMNRQGCEMVLGSGPLEAMPAAPQALFGPSAYDPADLPLPADPVHRALKAIRERCDTWTAVALGIGVDGECLARVLRARFLTRRAAALWAGRLELPPVLLWRDWQELPDTDETEEG